MLNKLRKQNSEGFTIIEVMIVLAIAGLILLIVLLAVPALQRNSRNTSMKNDVAAVSAAISEYKSNNEGQIPSEVDQQGTSVKIQGSGDEAEATAKIQAETDVSTDSAPGDEPATIQVLFGQKCTSANSHATENSPRSTAIIYNIETSGDVAPRCVDA